MDSKKKKFFDGSSRQLETQFHTRKEIIDDESFLLLPKISSNKKTKVELKDKIHPKDFNINLKSQNIKKIKHSTGMFYGNHYGPGKGFGNADLNNQIRNGQFTRLSNDNFFRNQEAHINERQDIITKNYQDPKNIILPFPRGGENTRKSKTVRNNKIKPEKFEFEY